MEPRKRKASSQARADRRRKRSDNPEPIAYASIENFKEVAEHSVGSMTEICNKCGALLWKGERSRSQSGGFSMCCSNGLVELPPLQDLPGELKRLLTGKDRRSSDFRKNIRAYNSTLSFASLSANIDQGLLRAEKGVYSFKIRGLLYHLMGNALPNEGTAPTFAQIYIYDTKSELENRLHTMPFLDKATLKELQDMMHTVSPYVRQFLQVSDVLTQHTDNIALRIVCDKQLDRRRYNRPTADEVAVVLSESNLEAGREIVIRARDGPLVRMKSKGNKRREEKKK